LIAETDVLIDCITGNGFTGPIDQFYAQIVEYLNSRSFSSKLKVISIDIPSFNSPDLNGESLGLKANLTLALQTLKKIHVEPSQVDVVGTVVLVDVGIPVDGKISNLQVFDLRKARELAVLHLGESSGIHKGNRPKVLVIGGSEGKEGAAVLAARGALRAGASLVTIASTSAVTRTITPPEIMFHRIDLTSNNSYLKTLIANSNSVVIGPGLGVDKVSREIFKMTLENCDQSSKKLVIDADAIELYADLFSDYSDRLKGQVVITPHPKEFLHLSNEKDVESVLNDRFVCVSKASEKYGLVIVLKGARSLIASGHKVNLVPHREQVLAVGGSGDLLSGVLGAMLPRFKDLHEGTSFSVFVHAQAGFCAARGLQQTMGVFASEIGDYVPEAIQSLLNSKLVYGLTSEPFSYDVA